MSDRLRVNGNINDSLGCAARQGVAASAHAPALLRRVLAENTWQEFVTQRGEKVTSSSFAEFITRRPLKGLGSSVEWVAHVAKCDPELLDLFDRAMQNPVGVNQHTEAVANSKALAPTGTTEAAALRRLRKDAPALHADVLAGHLTAHAAMVKAGYRPRTISVPIGSPDAVARALQRHMTPEDRATVARALLAGDNT